MTIPAEPFLLITHYVLPRSLQPVGFESAAFISKYLETDVEEGSALLLGLLGWWGPNADTRFGRVAGVKWEQVAAGPPQWVAVAGKRGWWQQAAVGGGSREQ